MIPIFLTTLTGIFRDRVFRGIMTVGLLFAIIPAVSSLSMRQVTELSISLSLSLISFVLLLLAVFLGGTSLWKEIERRYTFSVLSLPVTRAAYVLGKYLGTIAFVLLVALFLGLIAVSMIALVSTIHPPARPVIWSYFCLAIAFDALKYTLLIAMAFCISAVSTSFFLPIFGTISAFLAGSAIQEVHEFIRSSSAQEFSPFLKHAVDAIYYLLPNFSAFDLGINAIYGIPISPTGAAMTLLYHVIYTALLLVATIVIFSRREMV